MTTQQDFMRDIIANPADDMPRLVYADWLFDHGQPERGEFIRLQIELTNLGKPRQFYDDVSSFSYYRNEGQCEVIHRKGPIPIPGDRVDLHLRKPYRVKNSKLHWPGVLVTSGGLRTGYGANTVFLVLEFTCDEQSRPWPGFALQERERELLRVHGNHWLEMLYPLGGRTWSDPDEFEPIFNEQWHRGFVSSLSCMWADWKKDGPCIVQKTPIDKVRLTEFEPSVVNPEYNPYFQWEEVEPDSRYTCLTRYIPSCLFSLLQGQRYLGRCYYNTREEALADLSRVAILWAQREFKRYSVLSF